MLNTNTNLCKHGAWLYEDCGIGYSRGTHFLDTKIFHCKDCGYQVVDYGTTLKQFRQLYKLHFILNKSEYVSD